MKILLLILIILTGNVAFGQNCNPNMIQQIKPNQDTIIAYVGIINNYSFDDSENATFKSNSNLFLVNAKANIFSITTFAVGYYNLERVIGTKTKTIIVKSERCEP